MFVKSNKKKGSLVIEISIAAFMILVCLFCYGNAARRLLATNKKRIEKHNKEASIDALSKEIKYNKSYSFVKMKLNNREWNFKYNEEFIDEIEKTNIENLSMADDYEDEMIRVKAKTINEIYMEIQIKLICNGEVMEKNIIKYLWMDDV